MYTNLAADKIHETATRLCGRIRERFPDAGLSGVAEEVCRVTRDAMQRVDQLGRPMWSLRLLNGVLVVGVAGLVIYLIQVLGLKLTGRFDTVGDLIQVVEPALGSVVFTGAFMILIWGTEVRVKRKRAFRALHELRSLAHIIDMHQLTKDPGRLLMKGSDTASSPERQMTPFQLNRYFDYCSELLSMISKIAALYAQSFDDPEALQGVDQVEVLANGLSRKIWQKMLILDRYMEEESPGESAGKSPGA